MTAMTLQAAPHAAYPDTAIGTPTRDLAWHSSSLVDLYLARLRSALPMHNPQIEIMTRLISSTGTPVKRFLDLGSGDGILGAALLQRYFDDNDDCVIADAEVAENSIIQSLFKPDITVEGRQLLSFGIGATLVPASFDR